MFFIVYVSTATKPFSNDDLRDLLKTCRANNTTLGVTGMLLYKGGNFMQVLEGDREVVERLYEKVAGDPRHRGCITLLKGPLAERQFSDWSMGFRDLKTVESDSMPGFSEFMNTQLAGDEFSADPSRCQKLLLMFKRTM